MKKNLLSLLMLAFVTTVSNAQSIVVGDINRDGEVTVSDVTSLVSIILGTSEKTYITAEDFGLSASGSTRILVGDMNRDGEVTVSDVTTLVGVILGTSEKTYITADDFVATEEHEYVDLGLPSGTLWAITNVGAIKPEDYGGYFMWGETKPQEDNAYSWVSYKYCNGSNHTFTKYCFDANYGYNGFRDNIWELELSDDVAFVNWGEEWRMPTFAQCIELYNNCTWLWTSQNGIDGCIATSNINGNTIFFPAAGCGLNGSLYPGSCGYYMSRSLSNYDTSYAAGFRVRSDGVITDWGLSREYGWSVRPVRVLPIRVTNITLDANSLSLLRGTTRQLVATIIPSNAENPYVEWNSSDESIAIVENGLVTAVGCGTAMISCTSTDKSNITATCVVYVSSDMSGTIDGRDYVDLGLPSGTLWATCNVGAESPEEYGDYFAWGETRGYLSGKTTFSLNNYKWCNGSNISLTKYCTDSDCGTKDNKSTLEYLDDVAYVVWGSYWRTPSYNQFSELKDGSYTIWEWTKSNNTYGYKITSKSNGNFIFLPAAGMRGESGNISYAESNGAYWALSIRWSEPDCAYCLCFGSTGASVDDFSRWDGRSVRPVRLSE